MQLRLLYVVSGTEGEHLWVSFLDFLFDLVESISIEVVRGLDEVCAGSVTTSDELAETALQEACFVASLRPARHGQWAQPLPSDHLDPRDPAAADWIRALPPDP